MASLEELKRSRIAARGWVKRASIKLDKAAKDGDIVELEFNLAEFDKRIDHLDEVQTKIEFVLPDSEVEQDVQKAGDIREEAMEGRLRGIRAIRARNTS